MAVAEEETMEEQDKGSLNYQESKVFSNEPHLCSVYDNPKRRIVTFEVYGLDTQDMLHKQYTYQEFDGLFRFNAELMNPNRKEGRYHWVIERLAIGQVGADRKLRLAAEVTKEVPELPIYETTRKIPTGRMDLKERQRLRDEMDRLQIKREEKIRTAKEVSKKKFLQHIFNLQEDNKRREIAQQESIQKEREKQYQYQMAVEGEEEEEFARTAILSKNRRIAADNKDRLHEEKEEEDLRQLRIRWRAVDAEKARLIEEARTRQLRLKAAQEEEKRQAAAAFKVVQGKREVTWVARDKRVEKKRDAAVKQALSLIPELRRLANLKLERNREYLEDWNNRRWPIFEAQLERMRDREAQRRAESDAVSKYHAQRAIPKKVKTKGKKTKAAPKKKGQKEKEKDQDGKQGGKDATEGKDDHQEEVDTKKDAERIVDGVEAKMREQMAEAKRRTDLEKKRNEKMLDREMSRKTKEMRRIKDYKEKVRLEGEGKVSLANERRLILKTREEERVRAQERHKEEADRLLNVRDRHVLDQEQKQVAFLMSH